MHQSPTLSVLANVKSGQVRSGLLISRERSGLTVAVHTCLGHQEGRSTKRS